MTLLKSVFVVTLPCSKKSKLFSLAFSVLWANPPTWVAWSTCHSCPLCACWPWITWCILSLCTYLCSPLYWRLSSFPTTVLLFKAFLLFYSTYYNSYWSFFFFLMSYSLYIWLSHLCCHLSILISKLYVRLVCREIKNPFRVRASATLLSSVTLPIVWTQNVCSEAFIRWKA